MSRSIHCHDDRVTLARVLRVVVPSLLAVSCGTTPTNVDGGAGDAGDEVVQSCGGCGCADVSNVYYTTTYTVCPPDDAGALDGAADASDASAIDAGPCFTSCDLACVASTKGSVCVSEVIDGGVSVAQCENAPCFGRLTEGAVAPLHDRRSLGETLAHFAWLEAASVHAFRRLARELSAHGAPRSLVDSARTAARDEIRHARIMRALAARHGASVAAVVVKDTPVRDLESIARENAVEACVVETFGAVLAAWQSERADDDAIRDAMRAIAPDELRHATLAWSVAAWIELRLSDEARARVDRARERAVKECVRGVTRWPKATLRPLGVPSVDVTRTLARSLVSSGVWRAT